MAAARGQRMADQEADGVRFADGEGGAVARGRCARCRGRTSSLPASARRRPRASRFAFGRRRRLCAAGVRRARSFAAGKQNDVPTLTGSNADEGGAVPHPTTTRDAFQSAGAAALRRSGRRVPEALSGRRPTTRPARRRTRARAIRRASSTYLWALDRATDREDAGLHLFLDAPAAGARRPSSSAPSTRLKCHTC